MEEKNKHSALLDRFMQHTLSEEERQKLTQWLNSDEASSEMKTEFAERWTKAKDSDVPMDVQQKMYHRIRQQLDILESKNENKSGKRFSLLNQWKRYAAVIALLILSTFFSRYITLQEVSRKEQTKEFTVSAGKGQRANIVLPDGTKVWLNSHTELTYDSKYGNQERVVNLVGEAYFEVNKDENCPFKVMTEEMQVEVLGTSFNIKAYKEDAFITTTLFSGSVRASAGNKEIILLPDQYVTFSRLDGSFTSGTTDKALYARLWQANELAFNKEKLSEIAVQLNRMYNIEVIIESEELKDYRFTGTIRNNSLDNVLEIIRLSAPIQYSIEGDTVLIKEKQIN